ncbi:MAG: DUF1501 domain-containing protein [Bryobacterales bacterium]
MKDPVNRQSACRCTRREALRTASAGFGMVALAGLMAEEAGAAVTGPVDPMAPKKPHFPPKVKNVILCYLSGGLSHIDSFDPKPRLTKEAGQPMPFKTERTMFNDDGNIMPSPWAFHNYGESGIPVSDLFPHIGKQADELTVIRSMTAPFMEHAQANFFHCGMPFTGFPSIGAWTTYGLGTENRDLPGYVVLGSGVIPLGGINMYGNGFLPAVHQSSFLYPENAEPVHNIKPKESDKLQRMRLDFLREMDQEYLESLQGYEPVETAIRNYETAYRMQSAVPELTDLSGESEKHEEALRVGFRQRAEGCLRAAMFARAAVGRARRALRRADFGGGGLRHDGQSLGPAWAAQGRPRGERVHVRSAGGGADPGLEGARAARRDAGAVHGRVRAYPVRAGDERSRPQPLRLLARDGWRRVEEGLHLRPDGRVRLQRGGGQAHAARPARDGAELVGAGPREVDLPFRGPGFRLTDVHGHVINEVLA